MRATAEACPAIAGCLENILLDSGIPGQRLVHHRRGNLQRPGIAARRDFGSEEEPVAQPHPHRVAGKRLMRHSTLEAELEAVDQTGYLRLAKHVRPRVEAQGKAVA